MSEWSATPKKFDMRGKHFVRTCLAKRSWRGPLELDRGGEEARTSANSTQNCIESIGNSESGGRGPSRRWRESRRLQRRRNPVNILRQPNKDHHAESKRFGKNRAPLKMVASANYRSSSSHHNRLPRCWTVGRPVAVFQLGWTSFILKKVRLAETD